MEILASEPDEPEVRLKPRRLDCARFLTDAGQTGLTGRTASAVQDSERRTTRLAHACIWRQSMTSPRLQEQAGRAFIPPAKERSREENDNDV